MKPRGSTLYEGLGAMLLLPVKWPRLTGAIGTGLQRRHIACEVDITWNLYQMKCLYKKQTCSETYQIKCLYIMRIGGETHQIKLLYIKQTCGETYQIKCLYIKRICGETYQIKFLYIKWICGETYQMKCLYIKQTYITLDNTPNKISKNIFMSFGHNLKYF